MRKVNWKFDPDKTTYKNAIRVYKSSNIIESMIVSKPYSVPDSAVREGTYFVREKGIYRVFEYIEELNTWIELGIATQGSHSLVEWNLFPQLPHKEYQKLKGMYNYLSNRWKDNLHAYIFSEELRRLRRESQRIFLRSKKNKNGAKFQSN